jgi:cytochrome b561
MIQQYISIYKRYLHAQLYCILFTIYLQSYLTSVHRSSQIFRLGTTMHSSEIETIK